MRDEGDMLNRPRPLDYRVIIFTAVVTCISVYVLLTAALVLFRD